MEEPRKTREEGTRTSRKQRQQQQENHREKPTGLQVQGICKQRHG